MSDQNEPKVVAVKPGDEFTPPEPLSDYEIKMIHAGLLIPSRKAILSMSREILMRRGEPDPDLV